MKILSEKKVFITVAASGIDRSTAIAMGKLGCRLFLTDIDSDSLKKTINKISDSGGKAYQFSAFDVDDHQAMMYFAQDAHGGYGPMVYTSSLFKEMICAL